MIAFTFALLAFTPFVGVLAQLQTCSDGGAGPCANGLCPMANHRCINTTAGEVCCEESKIGGSDSATTTLASTTTKAAACVHPLNPKTGKSDCPKVAHLCSDAKYYMVMHVQCPKTCGRCDQNGGTIAPVVPPTGCQDMVDFRTGLSSCATVASLCQNALYKDVMKQQCPKTCGYCQ
ncbi:shTK domain protein [Ancylostoma caninum]|uniref:ShTK domain protein n=1 Tax=Ancylostoma caninum TaxID=29170 RepID=A0A368H8B1_ANCCA|nr:shTK domain protein [Ancylostoma caninum]